MTLPPTKPPLLEIPSEGTVCPNWPQVCHKMLERFLPRNSVNTMPGPVTSCPEPVSSTLRVSLPTYGLPSRSGSVEMTPSSTFYSPAQLMHKLLELDLPQGRGRRIAIEGEAGMGKTLFLKHIAYYLLDAPQEGLPLWVSPQQLKNIALGDYLFGPWLEQAQALSQEHAVDWQTSFKELLRQGQVWLLADGLDYLYWESDHAVKTGPLSLLRASLQAWPNLNVILTCRPETRRSDPKGLSGFTRYQIQDFRETELIEAAICDYFLAPICLETGQEKGKNGGEDLITLLGQSQHRHLAQWLTAPIRLILFCRFWQSRPSKFPLSSAQLYQALTQAFFEWKAEEAVTNLEQRQSLITIFGELGKRLLLAGRDGTQPLSQGDVEAVFGKNSLLLRLALQLGWLIPRGLVVEGAWERGYGFFDRSFRDYFTALAIPDWHFFFHVPSLNYRVLEPQWRAVITFWLGRDDIPLSERQDFLEALLNFQDGCSPENFYGLRTLQVAAIALAELRDCAQSNRVLSILVDFLTQTHLPPSLFGLAQELLKQADTKALVDLILERFQQAEEESDYRHLLSQLNLWGRGQPAAIAALENQLLELGQSSLRFNVAETLGSLEPHNSAALQVFWQELSISPHQDNYQRALQGLAKIGVGHRGSAQTLLQTLSQELSPHQHRQTLACLEQIALGDHLVIASLLQRLRSYPLGTLRCQVAESLEKIDPGNPAALSILKALLQEKSTVDVRKQALYSLGELKNPSPNLLQAITELLHNEEDIFLQWLAVSSLSKIGQQSLIAVHALEELIQSLLGQPLTESSQWLLKESIDALVKIDPANTLVVQALIYLLDQQTDLQAFQDNAEMLGRLDPGNPNAINALLKLLKKSKDEFVQRQAATSLGLIDPGNLTALMALIHLLHNSSNGDVRIMAAQSLGQIGVNNPAAMAALIRIGNSQPERELLRAVITSLSHITQDNKEVAQLFLDLLHTQTDQSLRNLITSCLKTILPNKMLVSVVHQLRDYCRRPRQENFVADWELFWHCAQILPYPTFYQAWHQRPLTGEPLANHLAHKQERQQLIEAFRPLTLAGKEVTVVWIDCQKFLSPGDPSVDIYDQMLSQGCPEFAHGIPDTPSKLRLYWHQLLRQRPEKGWAMCFDYGLMDPDTKIDSDLLEQLRAFQGAIAIVSQETELPLTCLPLPYEQTRQALQAWLEREFGDGA